jgi:hypothetical protein
MGRALGGVEDVGVDERSERLQRRLAVPILAAALLVLPVIAVEESHLGSPWDTLADALNATITPSETKRKSGNQAFGLMKIADSASAVPMSVTKRADISSLPTRVAFSPVSTSTA